MTVVLSHRLERSDAREEGLTPARETREVVRLDRTDDDYAGGVRHNAVEVNLRSPGRAPEVRQAVLISGVMHDNPRARHVRRVAEDPRLLHRCRRSVRARRGVALFASLTMTTASRAPLRKSPRGTEPAGEESARARISRSSSRSISGALTTPATFASSSSTVTRPVP